MLPVAWVALLARMLLAIVFATAAAAKFADQGGMRRTLGDFGVPASARRVLATLLPLAEAATAVGLIVAPSARWSAIAALGLLATFSAGVAAAMIRGRAPDCHCFGRLGSGPVGNRTLIRNVLLAVPAGFVAVYGAGDSIGTSHDSHSTAELVAALAVTAGAVLAIACLRLWRDNRHLRRDAARLEQALADRPAGLPIGTAAPRFALRTVEGPEITLDALLKRGNPVALVFLSSGCGACNTVIPDLVRWRATLSERLTIASVTAGGLSEAAQLAMEYGLSDMLVDEEGDVSRAYDVAATPTGVIVTIDGKVARHTPATRFVVESLIRSALHGPPAIPLDDRAAGQDRPALVVERWTDRVIAR